MAKLRTIVPILTPEQITSGAGSAPQGNLTYRGGHLLTAAEVFTIFWGTAWQQQPQDNIVSSINQFFDYILISPLIDLLSEYSVPGQIIGRGRRRGTVTITTSEPGHVAGGSREIDDSEIQQALEGWITSGTIPQPDGNTLYFVYLPPGVTSVFQGDRSCQIFCGYHNQVGNTIFYAVEPFVTCTGCTSGQVINTLTKISSHELCEAITDPIPEQGWFDDVNDEIGDICNSDIQQLGGYTIQSEWSNNANSCLIRRPAPIGSLFHSFQPTPNGGFGDWSLLGDAVGVGQIAVISTASGGLEVFAVDTAAGLAWTIFQDGPNGSFEGWVSMGGSPVGLGQIAVGKNADGRLEVFAIETFTGRVWHTVQPTPSSAFGDWSLLGDAVGVGQIAVISTASGGLEVFAVDTAAGLAWTIFQDGPNGSFEGWVSMGSPSVGLRQIAVGKNADGRLEVFAVLREIPAVTIVGKTHIEVFAGEVQDDPEVQQTYQVQAIGNLLDTSNITWTGDSLVQFTNPNAQITAAIFNMTGHTDPGSSHAFQITVTVSDSLGAVASDQKTVGVLVKPNK